MNYDELTIKGIDCPCECANGVISSCHCGIINIQHQNEIKQAAFD